MSIDVIPVESAGAVAAERTGASPRGELLREIVRSKTFIVGAIIVGFWIFCAIFGYAIAPHNPTAENLDRRSTRRPRAPHLFGTDQLGRDILSRVITGVRNILIIVPLAVILSTAVRHRRSASSWGTSAGSSTSRSRACSRPSWRCRWSSSP